MRRGRVYYGSELAGHIQELDHEGGMRFQYASSWLADREQPPIGSQLPKREAPYEWKGPSPFFMGLLPEGWLQDLALDRLKVQADDWFGQMLAFCGDCMGAVHIEDDSDA